MLTLNLNLLYTVVNILVLFLLLRKFLYKPVMNIIAQRQKQVDDALNAAETSKQEAAAALNDAQAKLRNVDAEAAARRTAYGCVLFLDHAVVRRDDACVKAERGQTFRQRADNICKAAGLGQRRALGGCQQHAGQVAAAFFGQRCAQFGFHGVPSFTGS